eukprot:scaffold131883_cov39-Prasinocladus_malaysianus.AAC.1
MQTAGACICHALPGKHRIAASRPTLKVKVLIDGACGTSKALAGVAQRTGDNCQVGVPCSRGAT